MPRLSRRSKTPSSITSASISSWTSGSIRRWNNLTVTWVAVAGVCCSISFCMKTHFFSCSRLMALICFGFTKISADDFAATTAPVGHNDSSLVTPVNQIVTPAGTLIELPGMRPQALALSPDGRRLVTAGLTHELVVLDPATGNILQRVAFPSDQAREHAAVSAEILSPDGKAQLSFTGLAFSPDGSRIYLSNVNGDIKVFGGGHDKKISPLCSLTLPPAKAPDRDEEIPTGIAVSADGKKIYVALNLSNRLAELDAATGKVLRLWDAGVAPFDAVRCKNKIYVSNWGVAGPTPAAQPARRDRARSSAWTRAA